MDFIVTEEESWIETIDEVNSFHWDQPSDCDSGTEAEVRAILSRELAAAEKYLPTQKSETPTSIIKLNFKRQLNGKAKSASLDIDTLDLSVAMLRHLIESNQQIMQQLDLRKDGVYSLKYFDIGMLSESGGFIALPIDASLREAGIM
ncbi:hypothetical protein HMI55_005963, partial [Coelomomyces lativittatus]